jgi:hypothetical protein
MTQTSKADFARFQTPALFLLVGKNPLPNYVAARLLLKADGTLYVIHTTGPTGTGHIAQRLARFFPQHRPQLIPVDPFDTTMLHHTVKRYLENAPLGSVGLNYTGGTKVLAVHTYQVVQEFCQQARREPVFSYLDADTLELSVEPWENRPAFRRQAVHSIVVTLEDLFALHDVKLQGRLQQTPVFPDLARALALQHSDERGISAWRAARGILNKADQRSWDALVCALRETAVRPDVLTLLEILLAGGSSATTPLSLGQAAHGAGMKSPRELLLWLEGQWLENWALHCIRDLGYLHCARSIIGLTPSRFEIDVAVMRGYQLFALSCSVSDDPRTIKLKLLEIYTRARQMGGDEACVAAVCTVEDSEKLQSEIGREWEVENRVRVFGRKHLPELQNHLAAWFETL